MPVYLCQPGAGQPEPWRHGIQVYAAPFPINTKPSSSTSSSSLLAPPTTTTNQQQDNIISTTSRTTSGDTAATAAAQPESIIGGGGGGGGSTIRQQQQDAVVVGVGNDVVGRDLVVANWSSSHTTTTTTAGTDNNSNNNNALGAMASVLQENNNNNIAGRNNNNNTAAAAAGGGPLPQPFLPPSRTIPGGHPPPQFLSIQEATTTAAAMTNNNNNSSNNRSNIGTSVGGSPAGGQPIRRVRHAEVVLVDDVCIAYERYWLRLRWPGHRGGFAGYIAMGLVSESQPPSHRVLDIKGLQLQAFQGQRDDPDSGRDSMPIDALLEDRGMAEDVDLDDPAREETGSMPPSEPLEPSPAILTCLRTGLPFQSSPAMSLLAGYDDGVCPPVALAPMPVEPVFCRICREGVHDDVDDEQPAAAEDGDGEQAARGGSGGGGTSSHPAIDDDNTSVGNNDASSAQDSVGASDQTKGPVIPHPSYSANTDALQNPILAPCECAGSMAFVHYLCVEQWRCRSRHPNARHGLNCETCGTPYSLPPPSERPVHMPQLDQEEWLEAMPPHVMQALRQPHIWWQIGASVVRRRWLRPLAPVLMSPIVALYCRARRLLKKRGVARRRWACSLCRRRARWKCVRCLRSYYCSRQCQNVSWHIIHKHVCYKPARFWWSVVLYSLLAVLLFPGILRDPFMYDLGLCLFPASFIIMGILGGGVATIFKKTVGIDLRGRGLELTVAVATLWLTILSWGLVRGFFGNSGACHGMFFSYYISEEKVSEAKILRVIQGSFLRPVQAMYQRLDGLFLGMGQWIRMVFCTPNNSDDPISSNNDGCFEHLPHANADFFLEEVAGGEKCAADLMVVSSLYMAALFGYAGSTLWKNHERQRRRRRHAHQD